MPQVSVMYGNVCIGVDVGVSTQPEIVDGSISQATALYHLPTWNAINAVIASIVGSPLRNAVSHKFFRPFNRVALFVFDRTGC